MYRVSIASRRLHFPAPRDYCTTTQHRTSVRYCTAAPYKTAAHRTTAVRHQHLSGQLHQRPNRHTSPHGSANYFTMSAESCPILNKLGLLTKEHVKIKDPARAERLLQQIVDGGFGTLQVVADYDYTLTRFHNDNGEHSQCSWGAMDNSSLMPSSYRSDTQKLLDKYYPIETSATMTREEKIPHMVEWYTQVTALLSSCKISRQDLVTMVADSNTQLRSGTVELLGTLQRSAVPVLLLSAGMGDLIVNLLDKFNVNSDNIKIVSNFFKFNDKDDLDGFQNDMIHMFNKNENAIHSSRYFEDMKNRTNVILMGDSLGDTSMAEGIPSPNNILKIGFLNDKMARLPAYEAAFDVVLLDDQTMDLPNDLLRLMK